MPESHGLPTTLVPLLDRPSEPTLERSPGNTGSHRHGFGPLDIFRRAPGCSSAPPDAPKDRLRTSYDILGVNPAVPQNSCHEFDRAGGFAPSPPTELHAVVASP